MENIRLQFWNVTGAVSTFLYLFFGALAGLNGAGHGPGWLKILLKPLFDSGFCQLIPPEFREPWLPLAAVALFFLIIALFARWRKRYRRPTGFQVLPAPSGGYLRKVGLPQLKKEIAGESREVRLEAKRSFELGERNFAAYRYQTAAAEYQKSAFASSTMSAYLNLGVSLCYSSSFQKAIDAFSMGQSLALKNGDEQFLSAFFCNIGIPQRERGNLAEALTSFKRAFGIGGKIGDASSEASGLGNLGSLLLLQRGPDEAMKSWQTALDIFEKTNHPSGLAAALDNVGCVHTAKEDYKQALGCHRKARSIYKRIRSLPGETQALANMGTAYLKLGRKRKSLKVSRKALKLAGSFNSFPDRVRAHANIGGVYEKKGKLEDALESLQTALQLCEQAGTPLGEGQQLASMGVIYATRKNREEALKKLGQARLKFLQCGLKSNAVESAINLALHRTSRPRSRRQRVIGMFQSLFSGKKKKIGDHRAITRAKA